jgi:hypothetical protein
MNDFVKTRKTQLADTPNCFVPVAGALLMRALRWIVAIVALAVAVWISAALLGEAYGAGPPYYGRTTNMDKWTSPWPVVLVAAVVVLAIVAAALFPIRSKTRGRPDKEF